MSQFDLAILGAGTAGSTAARHAAEVGARVCLVEMDRVGGHYLHRGLFPVRTLLTDPRFGTERPVDWESVRARFRQIGEDAEKDLRADLEKAGVTLVEGKGTFAGGGSLKVESDSGKQEIQADRVILAMGSAAQSIPTVPFDDERILPLDRFLAIPALPENLLIIGEGPQAIETALFFNRLGVRVFLCDENQRLLSGSDPELIAALEVSLKQAKIKTLLNKRILSILKRPEGIDITLDGGIKFTAQKILVGQRRVGNTSGSVVDGLGIEMGGHQEVWVNEKMETSCKHLFAAGSVTGHDRSPERSQEEGRVAAFNALGKETALEPDRIPLRLYTSPPIASVGCLAGEAHHKGFRPVEGRYDGVPLKPEEPDGAGGGFCKLVADRESRKIIGAQILGEGAPEMLTLVLLAMQRGTTLKTFTQVQPGFGDATKAVFVAARACLRGLTARR